MENTGRFLMKMVEGMFAAMMTIVVLLLFFFSQTEYNCKILFLLPNSAIMVAATVMVLLLILIVYFLSGTHCSRIMIDSVAWLDRMVGWICVGLFCAEVYISFCIFFSPGWDPGTIWKRAWQRIIGDSWGDYFSRYPNNMLLLLGETFLLKLNMAIGVFPGEYAPMSCIVVDCAMISLACWLTYRQMCLLTRRRYALVSFGFCVILAGFSPWMCVFYSDTLGIVLPILTLYLYTSPRKTGWGGVCSRVMAVLAGCVGYYLKPQCLIVVIAILCMELVYALKDRSRRRGLGVLVLAILAAVSFLMCSKLLVWKYESAGVELNKEESFGVAHFFMMGLNEETNGVFSSEDVAFSAKFETSKERTQADFKIALERLKQMRLGGYLRHLSKKLLTTFHDGTFAWWVEGSFYTQAVESPNTWASPVLKSLYYRGGERHEQFKLAEQMVWMATLVLTMLYGQLSMRKPGRFETDVLKLTVFGTILFLMLFECRARYLFMNIPLFCVLAGLGMAELSKKLCD